jgi:uncharacterized protein YeaO (DUF488 family)
MKREIYTTYFANLKNLYPDIVPISICGKAPNGWNGLQYKKLAPKWSFFKEWKENHDNDFYIKHFNEEVLQPLNAFTVVNELFELAQSDKIALVCYERPEDFCHRHLVANWIKDWTMIDAREFARYGLFE